MANPVTMRVTLSVFAIAYFNLLSAQIVINEVDYDQIGTDNAEFIEIKNIGTTLFPMQYVTVLLINGSSGAGVQYASISDPSWQPLAPGEYFVICGNQGLTLNCDHPGSTTTNLVQNGPMDAIVLINVNDEVLDVLSYRGTLSGYVEGTGTTATDSNDQDDISLNRWPDGNDTNDNNADFVVGCSTPGAANSIDPLNCDLTSSIASVHSESVFTVIPSPGGDHLVVTFNDGTTNAALAVYTTDGALVAEKRLSGSAHGGWVIPTADRHGQLLLLQVTSGNGRIVRRVLVP
ncbi:MAG: lamin tail domain-containing protein [Flavobacteriales bacterium]|nr:lamin tail domain-containing protein [Flavobacteriales bacterium]